MTKNFKEHCLIHNPDLLNEWADTRNPEDFEPHDKRYVKWKCKNCGYEWTEPICQRNHQYFPTKCPKCSDSIDEEGNIINNNFGVRCSTLINKEWSYRNRIDPKKLSISSTKLCWWKCPICGKHYKAKLNIKVEGYSKTCNNCKNKYFSKTSFAEQSIHYYLKKIFPDVKQNYFGVDIYIPEINTVVLYKSSYDYKKTRDKFLTKRDGQVDLFCKEHQAKVIKVCEYNVSIDEENVIKRNSKRVDDLTETIIELLKLLSEKPTDVNVVRDRYEILQHMKDECEDSLIQVLKKNNI